MSRLKQWLCPQECASSNSISVSGLRNCSDEAFYEPKPVARGQDFSVPPPIAANKFSSPPPVPSKFITPPPKIHGQPVKCQSPLINGSPMLYEQAVWQKVLSTVQSAVNHGQAERELLETLQGIRLGEQGVRERPMMELNNNGPPHILSNGSQIEQIRSPVLRDLMRLSPSSKPLEKTPFDNFMMGGYSESGRNGAANCGRHSPESIGKKAFTSSDPSSTSSNQRVSVPGGCSFCYAHYKRHCQMQRIKWPKMDEPGHFWHNHPLKDERGNVVCPELRMKVCELCFATGPTAHTTKFCPLNSSSLG